MKFLLAALVLVSATAGFADVQISDELQIPRKSNSDEFEGLSRRYKLKESPSAQMESFGVDAYYSLADTVTSMDVDATPKVGGAMGLGLRYTQIFTKGLGFILAMNYEFDRKFSAPESQESFSMFVPEYDITYGLSEEFYIFGGAHLPVVIASSNTTQQVWGHVGAQGGIALNLTKQLSFEAMYRTLNLGTTINGVGTFDARLWGLLARASFNFE